MYLQSCPMTMYLFALSQRQRVSIYHLGPVRSSPYKAEQQSALEPPARFPCDQGRDRRGGAGTWRMPPPRVRQANAHQTASNRMPPQNMPCPVGK